MSDVGTARTMFIIVIVVGCFGILWPKVFYPMMTASTGQSKGFETPHPHTRQERPLYPHADSVHPALKERGRAIPQRTIEQTARPGPMPGIRPPMGAGSHMVPPRAKESTGTMGIVMPLYTIGIVVFFIYTLTKVLFKKSPCNDVGGPQMKDMQLNPDYRKYIFAEEYLDSSKAAHREALKRQEKEMSRAVNKAAWDHSNEMKFEDEQMNQLRLRLEETERAMEKLMSQMGSVTDKLTAAKITEVLAQAQAQAKILKDKVKNEDDQPESIEGTDSVETVLEKEEEKPANEEVPQVLQSTNSSITQNESSRLLSEESWGHVKSADLVIADVDQKNFDHSLDFDSGQSSCSAQPILHESPKDNNQSPGSNISSDVLNDSTGSHGSDNCVSDDESLEESGERESEECSLEASGKDSLENLAHQTNESCPKESEESEDETSEKDTENEASEEGSEKTDSNKNNYLEDRCQETQTQNYQKAEDQHETHRNNEEVNSEVNEIKDVLRQKQDKELPSKSDSQLANPRDDNDLDVKNVEKLLQMKEHQDISTDEECSEKEDKNERKSISEENEDMCSENEDSEGECIGETYVKDASDPEENIREANDQCDPRQNVETVTNECETKDVTHPEQAKLAKEDTKSDSEYENESIEKEPENIDEEISENIDEAQSPTYASESFTEKESESQYNKKERGEEAVIEHLNESDNDKTANTDPVAMNSIYTERPDDLKSVTVLKSEPVFLENEPGCDRVASTHQGFSDVENCTETPGAAAPLPQCTAKSEMTGSPPDKDATSTGHCQFLRAIEEISDINTPDPESVLTEGLVGDTPAKYGCDRSKSSLEREELSSNDVEQSPSSNGPETNLVIPDKDLKDETENACCELVDNRKSSSDDESKTSNLMYDYDKDTCTLKDHQAFATMKDCIQRPEAVSIKTENESISIECDKEGETQKVEAKVYEEQITDDNSHQQEAANTLDKQKEVE